MTTPRAYGRFLNTEGMYKGNVKIHHMIDSRLRELFKQECKKQNLSMDYVINSLVAKWTMKRIKAKRSKKHFSYELPT